MAQEKRQQAVHDILRTLHKNADKALRELFAKLNYDYVGQSLSSRKWPESAKGHLSDDPILFATGGENDAFHVIYTRLAGDTLLRNAERPIVNQLLRDHPYAPMPCLSLQEGDTTTDQKVWPGKAANPRNCNEATGVHWGTC